MVQPFPKVCHPSLGKGKPGGFPLPDALQMYWQVRGGLLIPDVQDSGTFTVTRGITQGWVTTNWFSPAAGWKGQFLFSTFGQQHSGALIKLRTDQPSVVVAFLFKAYTGPPTNPVLWNNTFFSPAVNSAFYSVAATISPPPKPN